MISLSLQLPGNEVLEVDLKNLLVRVIGDEGKSQVGRRYEYLIISSLIFDYLLITLFCFNYIESLTIEVCEQPK